jgi:hypothetical protein
MSDDVLPFFARNQFKQKLAVMMEEASLSKKKNENQETFNKIAEMMNPNAMFYHDPIKVMAHIDAQDSGHNFLKMRNFNSFTKANLDGLKILLRLTANRGKNSVVSLFSPTLNSLYNF